MDWSFLDKIPFIKNMLPYIVIFYGCLLVLFLLHWPDRLDYYCPYAGKSGFNERKEYALTQAFIDFYGHIIDTYTDSFRRGLCLEDFERARKINWSFAAGMPKAYFDQAVYEFLKIYRNDTYGIVPLKATPESELYMYGHATPEECYKLHPETFRYGLDKPYKLNKIEHPFNLPSKAHWRTIKSTVAAPLRKYSTRYGWEAETAPIEYTFTVVPPDKTRHKIYWEDIVLAMDPETIKKCRELVSPCTPEHFLKTYLAIAEEDLILPGELFDSLNFYNTVTYGEHEDNFCIKHRELGH
jgi:hypothetical protein